MGVTDRKAENADPSTGRTEEIGREWTSCCLLLNKVSTCRPLIHVAIMVASERVA
jgi:hypothetical protein